MKHNEKQDFTQELIKTARITQGRIDTREVYRDFIAYCALAISIPTDPVHREMREKQLTALEAKYSQSEHKAFASTLKRMTEVVSQNIERGVFNDVLSLAYFELSAHNKHLKQEFTPPDISRLMAALMWKDPDRLPNKGYITLSDPTCGGGMLPLMAAERLCQKGFNPSKDLVVQAVDVDLTCVQMTYIHLSLYGIPAVIIHGDCLTLKEYDRWYTPVYIWGQWVWQESISLQPGRNESDELLKVYDQPMYGAVRYMTWAEQKGEDPCNNVPKQIQTKS